MQDWTDSENNYVKLTIGTMFDLLSELSEPYRKKFRLISPRGLMMVDMTAALIHNTLGI